MHSIARLARRAAVPILFGITLVSCEDDRITDIARRLPQRPLFSHVTVPPPAGSYDLPDPTTSGGDGSAVPERETGITIPEGAHYVRVRVTGGILVSRWIPGSSELDGQTIGPWGLNGHMGITYCPDINFCALQVYPFLYTLDNGGWGFILNDMGNYVGESVVLVTGPGSFTVRRIGLSCAGDDGICFGFSGHQTLAVDFVALALHASDTTPAPGQVVHFEAEGVNVSLGTPADWQWWPAGRDYFTAVDTCADHLQCDFAPSSDGHMVAQSWVGSGYVAGKAEIKPAQAAAVTIVKAKGPNPGGSFTTYPGESTISLEAQTTPASLAPQVAWEVIDAPDDQVATDPPGFVSPGATSSFLMPVQNGGRWSEVGHNDGLDKRSLAIKVTAAAASIRSAPATVRQDLFDTIREEYIELGVVPRVPGRGEFGPHDNNTGDYPGAAVVNRVFDADLAPLRGDWKEQWQVNDMYRDPLHNRYHLPSTEKADPNSKHQYGCAADLQTFPYPRISQTDKAEASFFWKRLAHLAQKSGFAIEPMTGSGVGHVHVQKDCH